METEVTVSFRDMMAMMLVDTARLSLRPPTGSDLQPYVDIHEDPEVLEYLTTAGPLRGREAAWRLLAVSIGHWQLRGYGQWTVVEKATDEIIGRVGLWHPEGWPGLEVGWVIRRSRWGQGFATEAARAAVDFAFTTVGAEHLISLIHPQNARSIRVAEKLGEQLEGTHEVEGETHQVYGIRRGKEGR